MVKPKDWNRINTIRRQLYYDSIDDINNVMDKLSILFIKEIDKTRLEIHNILHEKAELYKNKNKS